MVDTPGNAITETQFRQRFAVFGDAIANSSNPNMMFGVWSAGLARSWTWAGKLVNSCHCLQQLAVDDEKKLYTIQAYRDVSDSL
jgi:hypothetical protein